MAKPLTRTPQKIYHYVDGAKVDGAHVCITGDVTDLWGDVSGLRGDVTDLWGYVSGLRGNVTGLRGDVTGLRGDMGQIPDSARPCDISDWIEE
jgi:hypothetical protein